MSQNMTFILIRKHKLIYFFVTQNNFSGKYKNEIISNISIGILICISIFNGFSANHKTAIHRCSTCLQKKLKNKRTYILNIQTG